MAPAILCWQGASTDIFYYLYRGAELKEVTCGSYLPLNRATTPLLQTPIAGGLQASDTSAITRHCHHGTHTIFPNNFPGKKCPKILPVVTLRLWVSFARLNCTRPPQRVRIQSVVEYESKNLSVDSLREGEEQAVVSGTGPKTAALAWGLSRGAAACPQFTACGQVSVHDAPCKDQATSTADPTGEAPGPGRRDILARG